MSFFMRNIYIRIIMILARPKRRKSAQVECISLLAMLDYEPSEIAEILNLGKTTVYENLRKRVGYPNDEVSKMSGENEEIDLREELSKLYWLSKPLKEIKDFRNKLKSLLDDEGDEV